MLPALTSVDELRADQLRKLKWSLSHAYLNAPYYRAKCISTGVTADDLKYLEDLSRFPFTLKSDFRDSYPFGMLAVPRESCVRIHASSGTTGKPTIVGYTRADLDLWDTLIARCLLAAGGKPGDLLHNAFGYGLFTGGLGLHGGAEKLGCTVVPASGGQTERQVQLICDLKPRIVCATPSYMLTLAESLQRAGVDPRETALEIGLHGAEPWSDELRAEIENRFGIVALDLYGLSEVLGPGIAQERADARGKLSLWEDEFYPEIVNPETGDALPDGEEGELVLTSLSKEAVPIIRYRTGDISRLSPPSGDIPVRQMDRITGRCDDMLIIRGVNIFPRQIEELIVSEPGLSSHYRIEIRRNGAMDRMCIVCEAVENGDAGDARSALALRMKSKYGLTAEVVIAPPGTLPRSEGKAKRVYDYRKQNS